MRFCVFFLLIISITSCWWKADPGRDPGSHYRTVWGNKPVYGIDTELRMITFSDTPLPVKTPGNIYAKGNRIYQLETGKGIHVIDNSIPTQAHRTAFIHVNGSSQISIKDNFLYVNNYNDLVVLDISNPGSVTVASRVHGAFPDGRRNYYNSEPEESGYYQCPRYDSLVVSWQKDSIMSTCYKP